MIQHAITLYAVYKCCQIIHRFYKIYEMIILGKAVVSRMLPCSKIDPQDEEEWIELSPICND